MVVFHYVLTALYLLVLILALPNNIPLKLSSIQLLTVLMASVGQVLT